MKLSIFEKNTNSWNYATLAFAYAALWYSLVLWIMFTFFPVDASADSDTTVSLVEAIGVLVAGVVAAPLIENFIFTKVLNFFMYENSRSTAFVGALIAAAVHASFRSLIAFGIFYIIAAIYLTNAKDNPRYAFWLGVLVHAIFNIPGSLVPLLEYFGIFYI